MLVFGNKDLDLGALPVRWVEEFYLCRRVVQAGGPSIYSALSAPANKCWFGTSRKDPGKAQLLRFDGRSMTCAMFRTHNFR